MESVTTSTKDRNLVSSRVIDAPRDVVFRAFTNPDQLRHWWGPHGFSTTIHAFNLTPGGAWNFTMHSPDGTDYDNKSEFIEIIGHERIVFNHLQPVHGFRMTLLFEALEEKTRFSYHMLFETLEEYNRVKSFIEHANEENFDRLEAFVGNRI